MKLLKLFSYSLLFIDSGDNIVFFWLTGNEKKSKNYLASYFRENELLKQFYLL